MFSYDGFSMVKCGIFLWINMLSLWLNLFFLWLNQINVQVLLNFSSTGLWIAGLTPQEGLSSEAASLAGETISP